MILENEQNIGIPRDTSGSVPAGTIFQAGCEPVGVIELPAVAIQREIIFRLGASARDDHFTSVYISHDDHEALDHLRELLTEDSTVSPELLEETLRRIDQFENKNSSQVISK